MFFYKKLFSLFLLDAAGVLKNDLPAHPIRL